MPPLFNIVIFTLLAAGVTTAIPVTARSTSNAGKYPSVGRNYPRSPYHENDDVLSVETAGAGDGGNARRSHMKGDLESRQIFYSCNGFLYTYPFSGCTYPQPASIIDVGKPTRSGMEKTEVNDKSVES